MYDLTIYDLPINYYPFTIKGTDGRQAFRQGFYTVKIANGEGTAVLEAMKR